MLTFGVDPASKIVGVACFHDRILSDWAVLRVPASRPALARCCQLSDMVAEWVADRVPTGHEGKPRIFVEAPGGRGRQGGRGLITLGMAYGMIVASCRMRGWEIQVVTVGEWSRMGGSRCLPKEDRMRLVLPVCGGVYDPENDTGLDAADAIGVAAYGMGLRVTGGRSAGSGRSSTPARSRGRKAKRGRSA